MSNLRSCPHCDNDKEMQMLKEKLMKARSIIHRSTSCDVDDSFNHADDCERCAFLRGVRE